MTTSGTTSLFRAGRTLWRRAPFWRFSLMSALLLTMLFLLFPPAQPDVSAPGKFDQATYTSQSTSHNENNTPKPSPAVAPMPAAEKNPTDSGETMTERVYRDSILTSGFNVPLPDGEWRMLAYGRINSSSPPMSGVQYYLGKIDHNRLIGGVIIYAIKDTNQLITAASPIKIFPGCNKTDAVYMYKDDPFDNAFPSCWDVFRYFATDMHRWADSAAPVNPLVRAAARGLDTKSVSYPKDMPSINFLLIKKWGFLYITYQFNPEVEGITSSEVPTFVESDWAPGNIGRFPEKLAFEEKLKVWGTAMWPRVKAAFMAAQVH